MGVEGYNIKVVSLEKNIRSKKTLGRPRYKAVLDILENTLSEKKKKMVRNYLLSQK